jgi:hypothetical protein
MFLLACRKMEMVASEYCMHGWQHTRGSLCDTWGKVHKCWFYLWQWCEVPKNYHLEVFGYIFECDVWLHTVIHAYSNGMGYSRIAWGIGYETYICAGAGLWYKSNGLGYSNMAWDIIYETSIWSGAWLWHRSSDLGYSIIAQDIMMRPIFGLEHD